MEKRFEMVKYTKYRSHFGDFRIVSADENFQDVLGYTPEDIAAGLFMKDIIPDDELEEYFSTTQNQLSQTGEIYLGHRLRKKDGQDIFVYCYGKSVTEGDDLFCDILITDLTDNKELEFQLDALTGANTKLQKDLSESDRLMENVLDNLAGGVGVFDVREGHIDMTYLSKSFTKMFGVRPEQVGTTGDDFINIAVGDDKKLLRKQIKSTIFNNKTTVGTYRFYDMNDLDHIFWVQVCISLLAVKKGVFTICTVFMDMTSIKEAEMEKNAQNEMLKLVTAGSGEMLFQFDLQEDTLNILRYENGDLNTIYRTHNYLRDLDTEGNIYTEDLPAYKDTINALANGETNRTIELRLKFEQMPIFEWHRMTLVTVMDANDTPRRIVGKVVSIQEDMLKNQELMLRAERDSLTGIYNHSTFTSKVATMLADFTGCTSAMYIMDLDDFKIVNDTLGHYAGDDLLCETAVVLETVSALYGGFSGRLGGDEFVMFVPDIMDKETAISVAKNINASIKKIECSVSHTASIGLAINEITPELNFDKIYYQADQALYTSKRLGKNCFTVFEEEKEKQDAPKQETAKKVNYSDDEDYMLDDMEDAIFIYDMTNYELLFLNKPAKKFINIAPDDESYVGKNCQDVFAGVNHSDATNDMLSYEKNTISFFRNNVDNDNYFLRERILTWKGRKCRMSVATNISDPKKVTNIIRDKYSIEDALAACLTSIAKEVNDGVGYGKLLETLGEFYGGSRACLVEYTGGTKHIYEWKTANTAGLSDVGHDFEYEGVKEELTEISSAKGSIILNHIEDYPFKDSPFYKFCVANRIWSICGVAIRDAKGNYLGRLLVFNPKQHNGDLKLLRLVSLYMGSDIAAREIHLARSYDLTHDSVTKALNRASYINYCASRKAVNSVGLCILDVNNMRTIYEEFGQSFMDELVVKYYELLKKHFPGRDIYRTGDDTYIVVCENMKKNIFLDIIAALKTKLEIDDYSACIGYVWDDFDKDVRRMELHAQDMLYIEKQKWYEANGEESVKWSTMTGDMVREDLANGVFSINLQPKVNYDTGKIYGAEALLRYGKDENLASVIDRLERSHNIRYVDLFVLETVCKTLVAWAHKGLPMIPISCNFSRVSLLEEDMPARINEIVEQFSVPKDMIEIEITESIGEMEQEMVSRIANKLHAAGFRLAMDDFGTKYSNIAILSSMKFDVIKLDRSMVYNIDTDKTARKILKHLVEMCIDLDVECIAEGVENVTQAGYLSEMGCKHIQGYLYSKPLDVDSFERMYINQGV